MTCLSNLDVKISVNGRMRIRDAFKLILSTYHVRFHFYQYSAPLMPKDLTSRV